MPAPKDPAKYASWLENCRVQGQRAARERFTVEHQRAAGRVRGLQMTWTELSKLGKRGYRAAVKKHGEGFVFEALVKHQREHASELEVAVSGMLVRLGVPFSHIWRVSGDRMLTVDFMVTDLHTLRPLLAIEVDGPPHTERFALDQRAAQLASRADKKALLIARGIKLLELDWREAESWPALIEKSILEVTGN